MILVVSTRGLINDVVQSHVMQGLCLRALLTATIFITFLIDKLIMM